MGALAIIGVWFWTSSLGFEEARLAMGFEQTKKRAFMFYFTNLL